MPDANPPKLQRRRVAVPARGREVQAPASGAGQALSLRYSSPKITNVQNVSALIFPDAGKKAGKILKKRVWRMPTQRRRGREGDVQVPDTQGKFRKRVRDSAR